MNMNTTLTSNSYHSKYVSFICLHVQIHRFRKILIMLINDSCGSKHSLKFIVLVVVGGFIKKGKDSKQYF